MKGGDHSTQTGKHLLVLSAETYTIYTGSGDLQTGAVIKLDIPDGFDFDKRGKELLARIKSACRLFSDEEVKDSIGQ
jgi:hypothetical protein